MKLLTLVLFTACLWADPVTVEWISGPTVQSSNCNGCGGGWAPDATQSQDGLNAMLQIDYSEQAQARGASENAAVVGQFSIVSSTAIALTGEASKWIVAIVPDRSFEQILVWDHDLKRVD